MYNPNSAFNPNPNVSYFCTTYFNTFDVFWIYLEVFGPFH